MLGRSISLCSEWLTNANLAGPRLTARLIFFAFAAGVVTYLTTYRAHSRFGTSQIAQVKATFGTRVNTIEMFKINCVKHTTFRTFDRTLARWSTATANRVTRPAHPLPLPSATTNVG